MKRFIAAIIILLGSTLAQAEPSVYLTSGFISKHFASNHDYNEFNYGIGSEYHFNDTQSISVGYYKNSVRRDSIYLHYVWQPLKIKDVEIGIAMGVVNGYPDYNGGRFAIAVLPAVSWMVTDRIGLNLTYIPTVKNIEGAVALQVKYKF